MGAKIIIDGSRFFDESPSAYLIRNFTEQLSSFFEEDEILLLLPDNRFQDVLPRYVTAVKINMKFGGGLKNWWWNNITVPTILKKYPNAYFIATPYSYAVKTKLPVFIWVDDMRQIKSRNSLKKPHVKILALSNPLKEIIKSTYALPDSKIITIPGRVNKNYQPLAENDKQIIKEKYTAGKDFFICSDANLSKKDYILLLKAYSLFKKMQLSNWKIVFICQTKAKIKMLRDILMNYRYRDDVVLIDDSETNNRAALTASAYAMLYICEQPVFPLPVFEAFQTHTPVLSLRTELTNAYADALIFIEKKEPQQIAEEMMLVYKNENFKNSFIKNAIHIVQQLEQQFTQSLLQAMP